MVTSQALVTPMVRTPKVTPSISPSVVSTYPGRTVETRCGQMFSRGKSASQGIPRIGSETTSATRRVAAVQGLIESLDAGVSKLRARGGREADGLTVLETAGSAVVAYFVRQLACGLAMPGDLGERQVIGFVGAEGL